jgi:hypothetical protein
VGQLGGGLVDLGGGGVVDVAEGVEKLGGISRCNRRHISIRTSAVHDRQYRKWRKDFVFRINVYFHLLHYLFGELAILDFK